MLTRNQKYTALEILLAAGVDKVILPPETLEEAPKEFTAEEVFSKFSVNIGGISGITDPNKVILVSPDTEKLVVLVAGQSIVVELGEAFPTEQQISEGARAALDADGHAKNPAVNPEGIEAGEKVEVRVEEGQ